MLRLVWSTSWLHCGRTFVKDGQYVFLYRFFRMLRCNRGQTDFQHWIVKNEIARLKAVDAWLDLTTPRPDPASAEVWRVHRRARVGQFPIMDNLAALMADLSESQRETMMNLIYLTAITVQQLREFLIALFHAPKSSLKNPSWTPKTGSRSFIATSHCELDECEGHWVQDADTGEEDFLRTNVTGSVSPSKASS